MVLKPLYEPQGQRDALSSSGFDHEHSVPVIEGYRETVEESDLTEEAQTDLLESNRETGVDGNLHCAKIHRNVYKMRRNIAAPDAGSPIDRGGQGIESQWLHE